MDIWKRKKPIFGFVSTRFAGLDGVSLETEKWAQVLTQKGCAVFYLAGECDRDKSVSLTNSFCHFANSQILALQKSLFIDKNRTTETSLQVDKIKKNIKKDLYKFYKVFSIEILVVENASAIPMNIPLGMALAEFIAETNIPVIAHHHDFYWERDRFLGSSASDYLGAAFPPDLPSIKHVVINSLSGKNLSRRKGVNWTLIPNVIDFKDISKGLDEYNADFRESFGIRDNQLLVLHPTRIVSRKVIETSIEVVHRLKKYDPVLIITHKAGDEGSSYLKRVIDYASLLNVPIKMISERIDNKRGKTGKGEKIYSFLDSYYHADLVSYPSRHEGYGNAFVEAVYTRKLILINKYSIYNLDIEPQGFKVVSFDQFITNETIEEIESLLKDRNSIKTLTEKNYMLGWRYLSYEMLEEKIEQLLIEIFGS